VVVVRGERVLYCAGHGYRARAGAEPVDADTLFPLGSCTKAFTTFALAQLVAAGKLTWDDPVRRHLPTFRLHDPVADAQVCVRDLVTHRTGLASHDWLWYRGPWEQTELVRRVQFLPSAKPFRSAFQYQTILFVAAGQVAESAGGQPWADQVQHRILTPLGMTRTGFTTTNLATKGNVADGHYRGLDGKLTRVPWYPLPVPHPAGSIHTSARDLGPWLRLHLNRGQHAGQTLLAAEHLRPLHTTQMTFPLAGATQAQNPEATRMGHGMGWATHDYRGKAVLAHAGIIDGFRAHCTLLPDEQLGVAILANVHDSRVVVALTNVLVDALLELPPRDWHRIIGQVVEQEVLGKQQAEHERTTLRAAKLPPRLPLADYAGTYSEPAYGSARITFQEGRLHLSWGQLAGPLTPLAGEQFTIDDAILGPQVLEFVLNANRRVSGLRCFEMTWSKE
jgi:CubicO group peptidase (beta-lactamase class C family)